MQEKLTGARGGEEISDSEQADVWSLGGRGIPHVRLSSPAKYDKGQPAEAKASASPPAEEAAESTPPLSTSPNYNSHDDVDDDSAFSSDGAESDCNEMPILFRRAMRETYTTKPHDDEGKRKGMTRAQNRALNLHQATGLLSALRPTAWDQVN